jgi:hypothetical protein
MQLRFTLFAVINLRRDLHPQECAHAGRTYKKPPVLPVVFVQYALDFKSALCLTAAAVQLVFLDCFSSKPLADELHPKRP